MVEPSCRRAVAVTRNKRVGLIATAASVRSGAYERTIAGLDRDVTVISKACPLFVPLVENGRFRPGDTVIETVAREYLAPLRDTGIDTLIMGCTHYPLLKKMIGDFMGDAVRLVDSGKVTAQATAAALADLGLLNGKTDGGTAHYYVSDTPDNFAELEQMFLGEYAGGPVERIAIETY